MYFFWLALIAAVITQNAEGQIQLADMYLAVSIVVGAIYHKK